MMGNPTELLDEWLASNYHITKELGCWLLRSYTNDVYEILHRNERYILKIYGAGWRTEPEIHYEIALLNHLAGRGLLVAKAIEGADGKALHKFFDRFAVLFEYAVGGKPKPPFTPQLYFAFGKAIAQMHELSDDFQTSWHREPFDLDYTIDKPLEQIIPLLRGQQQRDFLTRVTDKVKANVSRLASRGLDWGPIHGDATLDNLHVTADRQIILYDFDSGGPGWRAADLQGWAFHSSEYQEKWGAFRRGYAQVRELQPADIEAAPYLAVAWDIWGMKIDLDNRILRQGHEKARAFLDERLKNIETRFHQFGWTVKGSRE